MLPFGSFLEIKSIFWWLSKCPNKIKSWPMLVIWIFQIKDSELCMLPEAVIVKHKESTKKKAWWTSSLITVWGWPNVYPPFTAHTFAYLNSFPWKWTFTRHEYVPHNGKDRSKCEQRIILCTSGADSPRRNHSAPCVSKSNQVIPKNERWKRGSLLSSPCSHTQSFIVHVFLIVHKHCDTVTHTFYTYNYAIHPGNRSSHRKGMTPW